MSDRTIMVAAFIPIVIAFGIVLIFLRRSVARRRKIREEQEEIFVTRLLWCFENNTVTSLNELMDLYSANFNLISLRYQDVENLGKLLRQAILQVSYARRAQSQYELIKHLSLMRQLLRDLEQELEKEEIAVPFSGVPLPERQLLMDILEMTSSDKDLIRGKLKQLADSITVRQDTIVQLGDEGKQSLKWAKWGLFGTIFFSLFTIALAIWK